MVHSSGTLSSMFEGGGGCWGIWGISKVGCIEDDV